MSLSDRTPGAAQTRSKQHSVFGAGTFPQTLYAADGAYTWSDGGRRYIDWMSALASVGLGHRHPTVEHAVRVQMENGTALSLPTQLEYEVAGLLCQVLKWPQQARFVKTGSEATAAAMQIARAYTHRRKVVSIGYHGWHEAHLPSAELIDVPWGSWEYVKALDCTVAAVIVEPMRDEPPPENWLTEIQDKCKRTGALFIMDEMVTGFRWAIGGASEYFGITPDLACYGKAMANGYPLACIVGPKKIMKHANEVSSTFGGEGIGLAAAKATIEVYTREPVIARLWEVGNALLAGCPSLTGYAVHPHFKVSADWTTSDLAILYVQYAARQGVLMHPAGMNPTYAHRDADVAHTIEVINAAVEEK